MHMLIFAYYSVRGRKSKSRFLWRCSRTILYREVVSFHANPWKGYSSWADSRGGGGGGQGVRTPPEKWPKIGFLCILVRFPLKSLKLPSQHSMLGHQSAKRHLNGVSLAGQWWPAFTLSHHQLKKKLSKLPPPPNKTFWLGNHVLCVLSCAKATTW